MPAFAVTPDDLHDLLDPVHVLLACAAVAALCLVYLALVRRSAHNRTGRPLCASCGYIVSGLADPATCPECGGDLRGGGVVRPGWRRPTRTHARLVGWTLLLPPVALALSGIVSNYVPYYEASRFVRLRSVGDEPRRYVYLRGDGRGYRRPVPMQAVQVEMASAAAAGVGSREQFARLSRVAAGGDRPSYAYRDAAGRSVRQGGDPDAAAVLRWMNDCGIDTAPPQSAAEAADVSAVLAAVAAGSGAQLRPAHFHVDTDQRSQYERGSGPTFRIAAAAFWLAAWLAGVAWLVRRRPRPQAEM